MSTNGYPPPPTDPDEIRARKRRNMWLAWALVAFILIVLAVTVIRLASGDGQVPERM